jgi:haloalkane dehalogenase
MRGSVRPSWRLRVNPTPGRRPPWVDDDAFPFESRFIAIDGSTIHYIDEGSGPVLLLYHGNPSWSFLYRQIVLGLRERFRCVAFDYPGMGLSTARPDFGYRAHEHAAVAERFVIDLDLVQITPLVQDWGGPIGLSVAARHPERHRALIVGNTWGWMADTIRGRIKNALFSKLWGGPVGRALNGRWNLFAKTVVPAGHKRHRMTPAELAQYLGPFPHRASRIPLQVFPREIMTARAFLLDLESHLPAVAGLPALILWADRDFAFKKPELEHWQRVLPRGRTHILHRAGHFFQDDAPDEVCETILDWWPSVGHAIT